MDGPGFWLRNKYGLSFNLDNDEMMQLFQELKKHYKYCWFSDHHEKFLLNLIKDRPTPSTMVFYTHESDEADTPELDESLAKNFANRIPVNMGNFDQPINDLKSNLIPWYSNIGKFRSRYPYMGQLSDYLDDDNLEFSRFNILAPLIFLNNTAKNLPAFAIHAWGVNLESTNSYYGIRYQKLMEQGKFDEIVARFQRTQRVIIHNFIGAFLYHSAQFSPEWCKSKEKILRIPGIGMGMYLASLPDELAVQCRRIFCQELCELLHQVFQTTRKDVRFLIEASGPLNQMMKDFASKNLANQLSKNLVTIGDFQHNLLRLRPLTIEDFPNAGSVYYVNAWDDLSFIGNGLYRDRSLDGYFVANAGDCAKEFINNSFLHNPIFSGFPSSWIKVPVLRPVPRLHLSKIKRNTRSSAVAPQIQKK